MNDVQATIGTLKVVETAMGRGRVRHKAYAGNGPTFCGQGAGNRGSRSFRRPASPSMARCEKCFATELAAEATKAAR